MIGNTILEGYSAVCRMVWCATSISVPVAMEPPVFRSRSNRGKLELEISSRSRCPGRKTLLVDASSIRQRLTSPGSSISAAPRADDPLGDLDGAPVGPDIDQLGGEVGAARRRRGVEDDLERPIDLEFAFERGAGVDEDVVPLFN